jgi:hypothetical protein
MLALSGAPDTGVVTAFGMLQGMVSSVSTVMVAVQAPAVTTGYGDAVPLALVSTVFFGAAIAIGRRRR